MSGLLRALRALLPAPGATAVASATARLDGALAELAALARPPPSPSPLSPLEASAAASAAPSPAGDGPLTLLLRLSNKQLKEQEPPQSLARLAQACFTGRGEACAVGAGAAAETVARDVVRASKLWVLAAGKGDLHSLLQVGLASVDGLGIIPRDWARAHGVLTQLADKTNHPWAHFALATLLLRRLLLAQQREGGGGGSGGGGSGGGSEAELDLASTSTRAVDVSRLAPASRTHPDCVRALQSLMAAAESGAVPPASLNLAHMHAHGVGRTEGRGEPAQAARWLRQAAQKGDPLACALLAQALEGTEAAAAGSVSGAARSPAAVTAHLYGIVGSGARGEAAQWWRRAALGGHPAAMHNLAMSYLQPPVDARVSPVAPDAAAALVWLERAADAGLLRSRLNAGLLRERGATGVAVDLAQARRHFELAKGQVLLAAAQAQTQSGQPQAGQPQGQRAAAAQHALSVVERRLDAVARKVAALGGADLGTPSPAPAAPLTAEEEAAAEGFEVVVAFESQAARDAAFRQLSEGGAEGVTGSSVFALLQSYEAGAGPEVPGAASAHGQQLQ